MAEISSHEEGSPSWLGQLSCLSGRVKADAIPRRHQVICQDIFGGPSLPDFDCK